MKRNVLSWLSAAVVLVLTLPTYAQTYSTCGGPNGLALGFDRIWVACYTQVQELNTLTGAVVWTDSVPLGPFAALASGTVAGPLIYVTLPSFGEVIEIAGKTGEILKTIQVGQGPLGIAYGVIPGGLPGFWTANAGGTVSAINNPLNGSPSVTTYAVPNCQPAGIIVVELAANDYQVWVTCGGGSLNLTTVAVLSATTGTYLGSFNLPGTTYAISSTNDVNGYNVWVGTGLPNPGVSRINLATYDIFNYTFGYDIFSGLAAAPLAPSGGTAQNIFACGFSQSPGLTQAVTQLTTTDPPDILYTTAVGGYGLIQSCVGTSSGGVWVSNFNEDSITYVPLSGS